MKINKVISKTMELQKGQDDIPWKVWTSLYEKKPRIEVWGDQISVGNSDYKSLDEFREALQWFVDQAGGKITWK